MNADRRWFANEQRTHLRYAGNEGCKHTRMGSADRQYPRHLPVIPHRRALLVPRQYPRRDGLHKQRGAGLAYSVGTAPCSDMSYPGSCSGPSADSSTHTTAYEALRSQGGPEQLRKHYARGSFSNLRTSTSSVTTSSWSIN